jgi:hypothetical protein
MKMALIANMATIYNLEKSITIKIYRDCSTAVPE